MPGPFDTRQTIVLAFAAPVVSLREVTCAIGLPRWRARVGAQANAEH